MEAIKKYKGDKIKESTLKIYVKNLHKLRLLFGESSFQFLNEPADVYEKLKDLHFTTQKNYITSVIVYLKAIDGDKKVIINYQKKLKEYAERYNKDQESGIVSEKQKNNFTNSEEIGKMISKIEVEIKPLLKATVPLSQTENELYQAYMMFNIYHKLPLRNDIAGMESIKGSDYKNIKDSNINYLVNSRTDMKLILNDYKTNKKFGQKIVEVEDVALKQLLRRYIKRNGYGVMFKKMDGEAYSRNMISHILIKYSNKYLGKSVSSTMLAKAYLSGKYGDKKDVYKEMKKDANIRGHSINTQLNIYVKNAE